MNKFIKIFDIFLFVGPILFALTLALIMSPLTTISKTLIKAYTCLFIGILIGMRGFFKTAPFYTSQKEKWLLRRYRLTLLPALTLISLSMYTLIKPPGLLIAMVYILSAACILLFIKKQKQR